MQLIQYNLSQLRDASLKVSIMTPKVSNTADEQIVRTEGEATLSDFIVAPQSRSRATVLSSLRELSQGRSRHLRKEGILVSF